MEDPVDCCFFVLPTVDFNNVGMRELAIICLNSYRFSTGHFADKNFFFVNVASPDQVGYALFKGFCLDVFFPFAGCVLPDALWFKTTV